jgi:hypothetical protein
LLRQWLPRGLLLIAYALFAASLTQYGCYYDAIPKHDRHNTPRLEGFPGYGMFLGIFGGTAWFANPAVAASVYCLLKKRSRGSTIALAAAAVALALCFLKQQTIIVDEGGDPHQIVGYGLGYWMWLSSISLVLVALLIKSALSWDENSADQKHSSIVADLASHSSRSQQ